MYYDRLGDFELCRSHRTTYSGTLKMDRFMERIGASRLIAPHGDAHHVRAEDGGQLAPGALLALAGLGCHGDFPSLTPLNA